MNTDGTPTASSSAGPATPTSQRKERGAIAAQACDNCRQRKQRCSEERPKCATCQRMGLECKYREPQPTKKDKTLVEILDRVKFMQNSSKDDTILEVLDRVKNVESLLLGGTQGESSDARGTDGPGPQIDLQHPNPQPELIHSSPWPASHIDGATQQRGVPPPNFSYKYTSAAHKVLLWPCIQRLLADGPHKFRPTDLVNLERNGSLVLWGFRDDFTSSTDASMGLPVDDGVDGVDGVDETIEEDLPLDWESTHRLSKAFFDTFNLIYPLVDRQNFQTVLLPSIINSGFDRSSDSILACLVLALGQISLAGSQGRSNSEIQRQLQRETFTPSYINEFRKRIGFVLTNTTLQSVQIFSLAAIYFEACCRHKEFWKMAMYASLACHHLLISNPEVLRSDQGDLVKRAFWHCSMVETGLNLELDLPLSGLDKFESLVGLPDFAGDFSQEDYMGNETSHYQQHFATQIVLRRLSVSFNATLLDAFGLSTTSPTRNTMPSPETVATTLKELTLQLDQWRGMLPPNLRWSEGHPSHYPHTGQGLYDPAMISSSSGNIGDPMFTTDLNMPPVMYPYTADVQTAFLRTRYLYLRYHLCRPFVYKALHHPDDMTQGDAQGVVECLKAMMRWPITMPPVCHNKRLIPCLFIWSQNLLSILIILSLSRRLPILVRIRRTMMNDSFDADADATVQLYVDWINEAKNIDSTAMWCWSILRTFYPLQDGEDSMST